MTPSIPASALVNVTPSVIAAGGTALDLNGLLLTNSGLVPIGTVQSFSSADDVGDFFGPTSDEYLRAAVYFSGFDNSNVKPGALLFAQYAAAPVAGYLRGGRVSGLTLTQLKAIAGILTLTVDGVTKSTAVLDLSAAASFSGAAAIIDAALTTATIAATFSYNAQLGAFVVTSDTTGAASAVAFATGAAAEPLKLTQATAAVVSPGAIASVPGTAMAAIKGQTQNWAAFATVFNPSAADALLFAEWSSAQGNRFVYAMKETSGAAIVVPDTTSKAALVDAAGLAGIVPIYEPSELYHDVFVLGFIASIDFTEQDGRATAAYRSQAGLLAGVSDETTADNLLANGYNFYGAYATANDDFKLFQPGSVTGDFLWLDSYVNQIWLNNSLQLAILQMMIARKSIAYNAAGYGMIEAACNDPIQAALNFGAIRAGVTLSASQIAQVNADAGQRISDVLQQRGWYLQIQDASAEVRAQRGSPPCTLWYLDGQSVQSIQLASVQVQ